MSAPAGEWAQVFEVRIPERPEHDQEQREREEDETRASFLYVYIMLGVTVGFECFAAYEIWSHFR